MGVPDGMENMMDDEAREALEMTKDELLARRDSGRPAQVRRSSDSEAVESTESGTVVVDSES
jgi:hypothetical protein